MKFSKTFFLPRNYAPSHRAARWRSPSNPDGQLNDLVHNATPHYLHRALAKVLKCQSASYRVIATPNGVRFRGKSDPFNHENVVAKLALLLRQALKILPDTRGVFLLSTAAAIRS